MAVVVRTSEYIDTIHNGSDQERKPGLKEDRGDASKAVSMRSRIKCVVGRKMLAAGSLTYRSRGWPWPMR